MVVDTCTRGLKRGCPIKDRKIANNMAHKMLSSTKYGKINLFSIYLFCNLSDCSILNITSSDCLLKKVLQICILIRIKSDDFQC